MPEAVRISPRGERTRQAILAAAERLFAERGFAETRLEDVADAVEIRRASIVYYFRDKRELYDAVLADVFAGLHERIETALLATGPLARRIPAAAAAWVDYVGERPSLARLLLREVADSGYRAGLARDGEPALLAHIQPFFALAARIVEEGEADPVLVRAHLDPVHVASSIAGATVFFVAAMPALLPGHGFEPLRPDQLAAHRHQILDLVHRLLGIPGPSVGTPRPRADASTDASTDGHGSR